MSKTRDRSTNAAMKAFNQPTYSFPPCLPGQSGWLINGVHYPCQKPEVFGRSQIAELLELQQQMNRILEHAMKVLAR
jgi:hypothetical protein